MIGHQFAPSVAPVRPVKEVQFGILSPEEIVGIYGRVIACLLYTSDAADE